MVAETRHLGVVDLAGVEVGVLCVQEQEWSRVFVSAKREGAWGCL